MIPKTRVPRTAPDILFEAEVPCPWSNFLARPIVTGDVVVLAGDHARATAVDARTGAPRWRVEIPIVREEAYTALPLPLPDGSVLVPEYQQDVWLRVHRVSPSGEITWVDDLAGGDDQRSSELRIWGSDIACKLFILPLVRGAADDYLISWTYRQTRFHYTECRTFRGEVRWRASEAMLASTADTVLGATTPDRRTDESVFLAHDKRSGAALWSLPARHRTFAAAGHDFFLLLDRTARLEETAARRIQVDALVLAACEADPDADDDVLSALEDRLRDERPIRAASRLVALDARDGRERWRAEIAGDVASVLATSDGIAVVGAEGEEARLYRFDARTGALLGESSLGDSWPRSPFASALEPAEFGFDLWASKLPTIVAADDDAIVWATADTMAAHRVGPRQGELWRVPLPAHCDAFRPRIVDRLFGELAIVPGNDRLYLRANRKLWAMGAP
jgi:hypothetical protein